MLSSGSLWISIKADWRGAVSTLGQVHFGANQFHEQLLRMCVEVYQWTLSLCPSTEPSFFLYYVPCTDNIHLYLVYIHGNDSLTN